MKRLTNYSYALLAFSVLVAMPVYSRQTQPSPAPRSQPSVAYPDTPDGLRRCLTDVLAVAKSGDRDRLAALIQGMEIPNFAKWFDKMYGKSRGKDSAELYRMSVDHNEYKFADSLIPLAHQDGQILVRQVNGHPEPGNVVESTLLRSMRKPVDIYFVSWRPTAGAASPDVPIGYFMFIEGGFRWDDAIHVAK
jgi:hypothetical protein